MRTGIEFIQRMREDAVFREKVNSCPGGEARLAFLKSQGYDFAPFARIMDVLSADQWSTGAGGQPEHPNISGRRSPGILTRISQMWRVTKSPPR